MGVNNGIHHVVRFRSGEIWYFNLTQSQGIFYRRLSRNGIWEDPVDLISNVEEDFSVSIDSQDQLHLICRSMKGELLYLLYNGTSWTRQVLSRYEPVRYTIRYPVIIPIKNRIHIIFAIGTTFNIGYWSLNHYYWDETSWHSKEITKLTSGYRLSPFYVDLSDKHIHLVYRGLAANKYQIFYCRYHLEHGIWSTPENVTHSDTDCGMPSVLIQDDLLHLSWTSLTKNDLIVKYKNKAVRNLGRVEWSQEIQLNDTGSNASFPRLIWVEGKLWCVWCQTDTLYGSSSEDQGANWTAPAEVPGSISSSFHYIHYSSNYPREKQILKLRWILGNVDNGLFLPIAGQYMNLPEYTPSPPPSGWEIGIEDVSQKIRKKAKFEESGLSVEDMSNKAAGMPGKKPDVQTDKEDDQNTKAVPGTGSGSMWKFKDQGAGTTPAAQSLENILLNEFDRQEEFHYSLISKLEEQSSQGSSILEESRHIMELLREHSEMLQNLIKDMEQIKQDTRQLKSRGLFQRLFHNEP